MAQSKPKTSSLVSVSFFVIVTWTVAGWLIIELIQNPSTYFLIKLVLAPILLVIGIIIAMKSLTSSLTLTFGDNKISYQHLLGSEKRYKLSDIQVWKEDVVKRKNSDYRRLSILLNNGKKLQLSNHENTNYDQVIQYLKKKVRTKK